MAKELKKVAIIDIGTNTINLLLAQTDFENYEIIDQYKIPAKIGKGGIHQNLISEEAFKRGLDALSDFAELIQEFNAQVCIPIATESLRGKSNASDFLQRAKEILGTGVNVISGEEEAHLIETAILAQFDLSKNNHLIMDIGGGSVEFIYYKDGRKRMVKSFKMGVSFLLQHLDLSQILDEASFQKIEDYISNFIEILKTEIGINQIQNLIGSAGTFETFKVLMPKSENSSSFTQMEFQNLADIIYKSDLHQKIAMPGMPEFRAEYVHVGAALVQIILKTFQIKNIQISTFSMKEGALITYHKNKGLWPKY